MFHVLDLVTDALNDSDLLVVVAAFMDHLL